MSVAAGYTKKKKPPDLSGGFLQTGTKLRVTERARCPEAHR
jgi:hypothetical protein